MNELKIYPRDKIVAFMNTGTTDNPVYTRMQGFTELSKSLNTITYSRRYVDEAFERETATGYSTDVSYGFDRVQGNTIHEKIARIHDEELLGESCEILVVDVIKGTGFLRTYDINPDSDGDGTDAYTYSGSFHASGDIQKGTATVSADGLTATFTSEASV